MKFTLSRWCVLESLNYNGLTNSSKKITSKAQLSYDRMDFVVEYIYFFICYNSIALHLDNKSHQNGMDKDNAITTISYPKILIS